jgi:hypothetical protein
MHAAPSPSGARIQIHVNPLTGCWEWVGRRNDGGYGVACGVPDEPLAHRAVWTLLVGPIPHGIQLDHLCRLRCCVNPTHLEEVTGAENLARMRDVRYPTARSRPRKPRTQQAAAPLVEGGRNLLADLDAALGDRAVPIAHVPALLCALVPDWAPYEQLTGKALRQHLVKTYGIKVPSTGNRWPLDPARVRAALAVLDDDGAA